MSIFWGGLWCVFQVHLFFAWLWWLQTVAFRGREIVLVNMDETAVAHSYKIRKGNVVDLSGVPAAGLLFQRTGMADTHAHCTLVAFCTPDESLQPFLPQIVLSGSKKHKNTRAEVQKYAAFVRPLVAWLDIGGWMNEGILIRVIAALKAAVFAQRPNAVVVLVMDVCKPHISNRVLAFAARWHVFICLIPASLTWLLQPLDTHVFLALKTRLREIQESSRAETPEGVLPKLQHIEILGQAVQQVLVQGQFRSAFVANGFIVGPFLMRHKISDFFHASGPPAPRVLTNAELGSIVGQNRQLLDLKFFRGPRAVMQAQVRRALLPAPPVASVADGRPGPSRAPTAKRLPGPASASTAPKRRTLRLI